MQPTESESPELTVVIDFLSQYLPFSSLPTDELARLSTAIEVVYYRRGQLFVPGVALVGGLRLIRSGAAEVRLENNQLLDKLGEGESFNIDGLAEKDPDISVVLIEDSLIYEVPATAYQALREQYREFNHYFQRQRNRRLRRAVRYQSQVNFLSRPVVEVMTPNPLMVDPVMPINEVAQRMRLRRVSSALITDNEEHLLGLLTDRDLRSRVVAEGLDVASAVSMVMTDTPCALADDQTVFDAVLLMLDRGFHHLPIMRDTKVIGILTSSDILLARQNDPVFLVQHIARAQSVDAVQALIEGLPGVIRGWSASGIRVREISKMLTAVSDAVTRRLIHLATDELGPAPAIFCWMGFGSQARGEQLMGADQDNGLLLADDVTDQQRVWFKQLAERVCDGLNACGYCYCPGNVMATNPQWRASLSEWKKTVDRWTQSPTDQAVMRVSIFYDNRVIYGDKMLGNQLRDHMLAGAQRNTIFQAALAANVLSVEPPLGIFRRFVVERSGEHSNTVDIKKRGVIPVVDAVRIHSLANGIEAVNTNDRIQRLVGARSMTIRDGRNLQDALDYMMQVRLSHQLKQSAQGEPTTNYVDPRQLTQMEQEHLRDAFAIVQDALQSVKLRYRQGL